MSTGPYHYGITETAQMEYSPGFVLSGEDYFLTLNQCHAPQLSRALDEICRHRRANVGFILSRKIVFN